MMTADIDHVGFVVEDAARELTRLRERGLFVPVMGEEDDGFRWVIGKQVPPAAGIRIELLDPNDDKSSPIARHLRTVGEGAQHLTFTVDDLPGVVSSLRRAGVRLAQVDTTYAPWQEAFIPPNEGLGVVVQLASSAYAYESDRQTPKPHRQSGRNQFWWESLPLGGPSAVQPIAITDVGLEVEDESLARLLFAETLGASTEPGPGHGVLYRWRSGTLRVTGGTGGISRLHCASGSDSLTADSLKIGRSTLVHAHGNEVGITD